MTKNFLETEEVQDLLGYNTQEFSFAGEKEEQDNEGEDNEGEDNEGEDDDEEKDRGGKAQV